MHVHKQIKYLCTNIQNTNKKMSKLLSLGPKKFLYILVCVCVCVRVWESASFTAVLIPGLMSCTPEGGSFQSTEEEVSCCATGSARAVTMWYSVNQRERSGSVHVTSVILVFSFLITASTFWRLMINKLCLNFAHLLCSLWFPGLPGVTLLAVQRLIHSQYTGQYLYTVQELKKT